MPDASGCNSPGLDLQPCSCAPCTRAERVVHGPTAAGQSPRTTDTAGGSGTVAFLEVGRSVTCLSRCQLSGRQTPPGRNLNFCPREDLGNVPKHRSLRPALGPGMTKVSGTHPGRQRAGWPDVGDALARPGGHEAGRQGGPRRPRQDTGRGAWFSDEGRPEVPGMSPPPAA